MSMNIPGLEIESALWGLNYYGKMANTCTLKSQYTLLFKNIEIVIVLFLFFKKIDLITFFNNYLKNLSQIILME